MIRSSGIRGVRSTEYHDSPPALPALNPSRSWSAFRHDGATAAPAFTCPLSSRQWVLPSRAGRRHDQERCTVSCAGHGRTDPFNDRPSRTESALSGTMVPEGTPTQYPVLRSCLIGRRLLNDVEWTRRSVYVDFIGGFSTVWAFGSGVVILKTPEPTSFYHVIGSCSTVQDRRIEDVDLQHRRRGRHADDARIVPGHKIGNRSYPTRVGTQDVNFPHGQRCPDGY